MNDCDNCKNGPANFVEGSPCNKCGRYGADNDPTMWEKKPVTYGDRIRAMSDEELAKQIAGEQVNGVRVFLNGFDRELEEEYIDEVKKAWPELVKEKLGWLKQEAKE